VLNFCARSGKPWLLLLPNYVATKGYFRALTGGGPADGPAPFFVVPARKYEYEHPEGTGHASSPFFSIWFGSVGVEAYSAIVGPVARWCQARGCSVMWSVAELTAGRVVAPARLNPKQRKKRRLQERG
jgi:hypothetical protein